MTIQRARIWDTTLSIFGGAGNLGVHQSQSCPGILPYLSYEATFTEQRPDFNPAVDIQVGVGIDQIPIMVYNMGTPNFTAIEESRTDTCGFNYQGLAITTPAPMPQTTTGPFEPIIKDIPLGLQVCMAHPNCNPINDPAQTCGVVRSNTSNDGATSSNRIVDGIEVIPHSWPWAVRLIFQTQFDIDNNTGAGCLLYTSDAADE